MMQIGHDESLCKTKERPFPLRDDCMDAGVPERRLQGEGEAGNRSRGWPGPWRR